MSSQTDRFGRHGSRLDAADASWHHSTPTPYDPPITYGGWNQCRSLGVRIAHILHAREEGFNTVDEDTADHGERPRKRRRLKHKVVIHTSPFLRCLQTSIAIAAGMSQYKPNIDVDNRQKRPVSVSPRLRATEGHGTARGLSSIAEPKHDFAHAIALKALHEHKRYRKSKLRVDAFLGEWLNPSYFEGITAPPPSAMMVTMAKAELMENEAVEIFQPTVAAKPAANTSLWGGANGATNLSRESTLDDWSPVEETLPLSPTRSRANTVDNVGGNDSGRKSPFRPGSPLQPLTSTLPKQETSAYRPPTPQYAVSPAQQIPRGYVVHARNACTDVDFQWDSSRGPDAWADGGEYGEEWSSMHKRIRRGLGRLVQWYSSDEGHDADEDTFGANHAIEYEDEEVKEDLVVIMVTHGAGCNALIGALTGQPVLLDVGMASLTMAVRRDDAPPLIKQTSHTDGYNYGRRGSSDAGLSSIYEMKFISSAEHLRYGADPRRAGSPASRPDSAFPRFEDRSTAMPTSKNASLGSIRRPSAAAGLAVPGNASRSTSLPRGGLPTAAPTVSAGLWTPPAARSPGLQPQARLPSLTESGRGQPTTTGDIMVHDFGNVPTSAPSTAAQASNEETKPSPLATGSDHAMLQDGEDGESTTTSDSDTAGELPRPGDSVPAYLSRRLSQERLWGSKPSGAQVERTTRGQPKRRWTVDQDG